MGRFILIDVAVALALFSLWYAWFVRYNRRRAGNVLQWVQAACLGKGRIVDLRWQASSSRLKATLNLSSRWFEDARLTIRLLPRPLPVQWALSRWRQQQETLTFEANMGFPPGFHLDVIRHRWAGHSGAKSSGRKLDPHPGVDHHPSWPRHSHHQRRLARRTQPGGQCAGLLARQGFRRRPLQLHRAALHRHGSARKSLGPKSDRRLAWPLPRTRR